MEPNGLQKSVRSWKGSYTTPESPWAMILISSDSQTNELWVGKDRFGQLVLRTNSELIHIHPYLPWIFIHLLYFCIFVLVQVQVVTSVKTWTVVRLRVAPCHRGRRRPVRRSWFCWRQIKALETKSAAAWTISYDQLQTASNVSTAIRGLGWRCESLW